MMAIWVIIGTTPGTCLEKIQTREINVFFDRFIIYIGGNDAT